MRKSLFLVAIVAITAGLFAAGDAKARSRRLQDNAPPPAAAATPFSEAPRWLTPADRARSGWIDGASPYNPEGSSNPQVPNSL